MFTVVIPARDRATLIGPAIEAALAQTAPPDRVIVVDDGSTDDTAGVAERAGATVHRLPQSGGSGPARTIGIREASSEWIAFLDSDDIWDPDHLQGLAALTDGHVLVSAPSRSTSGVIRGITARQPVAVTARLVYADLNPLVTSGTAVRRDTLLAIGGFRALARAQDFDCWLRVLEQGEGVVTGRPTLHYHQHDGQVSLHGDLNRACVLQILAEYADRPWAGPQLHRASLARFYWDDLRVGQRTGEGSRIRAAVRAIAARPDLIPAMASLAVRRAAERMSRRARG